MFSKRSALKSFAKFTGKWLFQSLFFNNVAGRRPATLLKKESQAQLFSCEFCGIFKNTFFYRMPLVAASVYTSFINLPYFWQVRNWINITQRLLYTDFYSILLYQTSVPTRA